MVSLGHNELKGQTIIKPSAGVSVTASDALPIGAHFFLVNLHINITISFQI